MVTVFIEIFVYTSEATIGLLLDRNYLVHREILHDMLCFQIVNSNI